MFLKHARDNAVHKLLNPDLSGSTAIGTAYTSGDCDVLSILPVFSATVNVQPVKQVRSTGSSRKTRGFLHEFAFGFG